jgi:hypothetical protein
MTHETKRPPPRTKTTAQAGPLNGGETGNLSSNLNSPRSPEPCKTQDPRPVDFALGLRSLQAHAMLTRCEWIFWGMPQDRYVLRFDNCRMTYAIDRIENNRAHGTEHFDNIRDAIGKALFHNLVDCENVVVEGYL